MISIDGNKYEGGGQILRTALALSTLTGKPFEIKDIRKGRKEDGLKKQHIYCIKALQELCDAKAGDFYVGTTELSYSPGKIKGKTINIDIETAGSITLVLQCVIIAALLADKEVRIKVKGGTDVSWSPSIDYFVNVFVPNIVSFSDGIKIKSKNRGYYPEGSGNVDVVVKPKYLSRGFEATSDFFNSLREKKNRIIKLKQGTLLQIKGISHASKNLAGAEVAERQARSARLMLSGLCPVNISTEYCETASTGSGITLWARFSADGNEIDAENPIIIGSDVLGEKGKKAELVGEEAARKLKELINSKAPVDCLLADQLIPFIALFGGEIKTSEITNHSRANVYVCNQFLGDVLIIDEENKIIKSKL